jgi:hypothetical protein
VPSRYIDRLEKGDHGTKSERRLSKSMGSRLQPASGALPGAKSDAKLGHGKKFRFRIENKSTVNLTMPLDLAWLTKITGESLTDQSIPTLIASFVNAEGHPRSARNAEWVMIPLWAFEELREAAEPEAE